jgi:hypothetical protein
MATPVIQDSDIVKCIKSCLNCSRVCLETLAHCLSKGKNGIATGKHLSVLQLCADSCQLSARMMIAESEFHHQACELTFEVATGCADLCERFADDEVMKHCAEVCRRCAESCQYSAGMTVSVNLREEQAKSGMSYRAQ